MLGTVRAGPMCPPSIKVQRASGWRRRFSPPIVVVGDKGRHVGAAPTTLSMVSSLRRAMDAKSQTCGRSAWRVALGDQFAGGVEGLVVAVIDDRFEGLSRAPELVVRGVQRDWGE